MSEKIIIGNAELWHGDCREILPGLPKNDLLLTDPPYGISLDKGFGGGGFDGFGGGVRRRETVRIYEGEWDGERVAADLVLLMLPAASVHVIWGGQFYADILPARGKWLFWDKCQTMPSFGDGELAWTSLPGNAVKQFTYNGSGLHAKEKERQHPTQKPVALMHWCLKFVPDAQTILDPFMGSGTTGVACAQLGRTFTGIERERKYFDIACERIAAAQAQGQMFVEPVAKPVQEGLF